MPGIEIGRLRKGEGLEGKRRNGAEGSLRNPTFWVSFFFILLSYIDICDFHKSPPIARSETSLKTSKWQHG